MFFSRWMARRIFIMLFIVNQSHQPVLCREAGQHAGTMLMGPDAQDRL
jgi:hypothetical protein